MLRIETTHGQEVEHLLVHFLFAVDQAVDHLFHVAVHGGHVEVEGHFGGCGRTGDVHQTVDADGVVRKTATDVQVGEAHAVSRINGF